MPVLLSVRESAGSFAERGSGYAAPMLQLSEAAAKAIEELAGSGCFRLATVESDEELEFESSVVDEPEPGDEVVEQGGARVSLDATAAEQLADQILDVHEHGDHVHF